VTVGPGIAPGLLTLLSGDSRRSRAPSPPATACTRYRRWGISPRP